jgi:hypothetical protein
MTEVCHTSRPRANESLHSWTTRVTHSNHHSWNSLMSLDSSRQYLFNGTYGTDIKFSMCLYDFFLFFFLLSLFYFLYLYCKLCRSIFNFDECRIWHLRLVSRRCHPRLSKPYYFSKYFIYCVLLFIFLEC